MKAIWTIDIDPPRTAEEVAIEAFLIMQRRGTSANCFTIVDEEGRETEIDIEAVWENRKALERAQRETRYYLVAEAPGDVGRQVCEPQETREAFDAALAELRVRQRPALAFFFAWRSIRSPSRCSLLPQGSFRHDSHRITV